MENPEVLFNNAVKLAAGLGVRIYEQTLDSDMENDMLNQLDEIFEELAEMFGTDTEEIADTFIASNFEYSYFKSFYNIS